jgi:hypothetical protein
VFSNTAAACGTVTGGTDEINMWAGINGQYTNTTGQYSFYNYDSSTAQYTVAYSTQPPPIDSFTGTVVSTTYAYSGKAFSRFECATSPAADCATPGPGNPYATRNSVTAVLQMGASLPASTTENVLCDYNFLSLTLNDGVNTITVNTPCATGTTSVPGATAWVTTDNNGNITAWYLDAYLPATGGPVTEDIHTLYDPSSPATTSISYNCNGCDATDPTGAPEDPKGEDKGLTTQNGSTYYGYVRELPGSFTAIAPGQGGVTTAGNCTPPLGCQNSPIASTVVVTMAGNGPPPPNDLIVETSYFIPLDPRGDNCGYNGATGQPTSILLSNVPVQRFQNDPIPAKLVSSLGGEVIPWNVCIPPGGAWVDIAIDEQLAGINGLNAYPNFAPPSTSTGIVACPATPTANSGYTGQLTVSAPRAASSAEEQQAQQLGSSIGQGHGIGPPQFVPAIQSCDYGKGSGVPARSITLFNVQFIHPNLLAKHTIPGTATNQQILVNEIASEVYYLRNGLLPLINFQQAPQVGVALQACYTRVQSLMSQGSYNCAAYQTYQCDQILKNNPVADVGPSYSVLRLPDPWGALHSDDLNLGFLFNAAAGITPASVSLDDPMVLSETGWPPRSCPTH